jgi:hypothetical protein
MILIKTRHFSWAISDVDELIYEYDALWTMVG